MTIFGKKLREVREAAQRTMKDVAAHMGWSVVYMSDIERGRRNPPKTREIEKISDFIGINSLELLDLARRERGKIELDLNGSRPEIETAGLVFARSWTDMSEEQARQIIKILEKED